MPPLNWLRAFEAAARHMSFTQAANEIGVTQAAVSQNVKLLEARLGHALFTRRPQRLELTAFGKAYFPTIQDAFQHIDLGTRTVFGGSRQRRVTIRATPGFAEFWLALRISANSPGRFG